MVANTFSINLPGWVVDDPVPDNTHDSETGAEVDPFPSSPSTSSQQNLEPMVEVEISTEDDEEAMWLLLQDPQLDTSQLSTLHELDQWDFEEVESALNQQYPSSESSSLETSIEEYALKSRLRSDCAAHKLQLVIKDGFKKLDVSRPILSQIFIFKSIILNTNRYNFH